MTMPALCQPPVPFFAGGLPPMASLRSLSPRRLARLPSLACTGTHAACRRLGHFCAGGAQTTAKRACLVLPVLARFPSREGTGTAALCLHWVPFAAGGLTTPTRRAFPPQLPVARYWYQLVAGIRVRSLISGGCYAGVAQMACQPACYPMLSWTMARLEYPATLARA